MYCSYLCSSPCHFKFVFFWGGLLLFLKKYLRDRERRDGERVTDTNVSNLLQYPGLAEAKLETRNLSQIFHVKCEKPIT